MSSENSTHSALHSLNHIVIVDETAQLAPWCSSDGEVTWQLDSDVLYVTILFDPISDSYIVSRTKGVTRVNAPVNVPKTHPMILEVLFHNPNVFKNTTTTTLFNHKETP